MSITDAKDEAQKEMDEIVENSFNKNNIRVNRYRRKRPKVDPSIFDSVLSHTRRSDASEKKRRK